MIKFSSAEKTTMFLALYVAAILAANLVGGKLTSLFGKPLSVAILALPIAYVVLSAINEVRGPIVPKNFVIAALTSQIAIFAIIVLALWLPAGSRQILSLEAYDAVFHTSLRIIVGSTVAFLISQIYTVWAFNKLKMKMYNKFAWLRYNAATISGQLIDTFLFMFIAFYSGDFGFTFSIALTYFLFKALAAVISTPAFYGAVWFLRGSKVPPEEPMQVPVAVAHGQKH